MPPWNSPNRGRRQVERGQAVGEEIDDQGNALQGRADQQGHDAAHSVGDPACRYPADDAESQHQRQHLRAAGDAETEVGAVGDDMDLRHRHCDATGNARHDQQDLQPVWRQAERIAREWLSHGGGARFLVIGRSAPRG